MSRLAAAVVSVALIVITASPVRRDPRDDGFPLSTYPMFAWKRPTQLTLDYALGVTATGDRRYLTPRLVGSSEVLQALAVIQRARATRSLPALCRAIAARVAADADYRYVVALRIVTGTHDAVDFLVRDVIGREVERARCEVTR